MYVILFDVPTSRVACRYGTPGPSIKTHNSTSAQVSCVAFNDGCLIIQSRTCSGKLPISNSWGATVCENIGFIINTLHIACFTYFKKAAPVAERLRALFLNHSIILPLCLVWVQSPHWPQVRQAKFCLRMCQVFFLCVLPFSPTY